MICSANQLTGFYMMATLAFNDLILEAKFGGDPQLGKSTFNFNKNDASKNMLDLLNVTPIPDQYLHLIANFA